jgi:predicted metallo-beta-lactamase superfamily hydrolase
MLDVKIIGTESLGVRGLCCAIETNNRKIVIDPGISLGYMRKGLMPHPVQIGVCEIIRTRILKELEDATDIVFSHFHGDHIPLYDANPYQLSIDQVKKLPRNCKIWANCTDVSSIKMQQRAEALVLGLNCSFSEAIGAVDDSLFFFSPVPHGEEDSHLGDVTMTKITDGKDVFIHASDIQFLENKTIEKLIEHHPTTVIASGPPIYLDGFMKSRYEIAQTNILRLAKETKTLIIDHHLLRSVEGLNWISELALTPGTNIICAADYMKTEKHMLEAIRTELYNEFSVPANWHELYARKEVTTNEYLKLARKKYDWFSY